MSRDIRIFGELLVRVRGEPGSDIATLSDLGLTVGGDRPVKVRPIFKHKNVLTDDFGPEVPAELLTQLAEVQVDMTLVHYDDVILDACLAEAQGGGVAGVMVSAGEPMGGGVPVLTAGNHYVTLNLVPGDAVAAAVVGVVPAPTLDAPANLPWRFFASVLTGDAVVTPLGTKRSEVDLRWRVIPYAFPSTTPQTYITVSTPLQGTPTLDGDIIITSPPELVGDIITKSQFDSYNAQVEEDGLVTLHRDPVVGEMGVVVSQGALLWDRQLQT